MAQLYGRPCLPEGAQVASDEARIAFHEVGDDRGGCSEPVKRGRNYCNGTVSYVKAVRRGQNGGLPGVASFTFRFWCSPDVILMRGWIAGQGGAG